MLIVDQQDLAKWVRSNKNHLDIAVAFWGKGAIDQLGLDNKEKSYRILLDLASGGTNPHEVRRLLELRPNLVRCIDRLHAKAYIGKNEVVIGSANASANGLGVEGAEATHWHELGLRSDDKTTIQASQLWFEKLWKESRKITNKALEAAEKTWKPRQRIRPLKEGKDQDLLDGAITHPDAFDNLDIHVVVFTKKLSKSAEAARQAEEEKTGYAYAIEGWEKMPINSFLICFNDNKKSGIQFDDPNIFHTRLNKQLGPVRWVDPSPLPIDYELGGIAKWRKYLERAKNDDKKTWKSDGFSMPFSDFIKTYARQ